LVDDRLAAEGVSVGGIILLFLVGAGSPAEPKSGDAGKPQHQTATELVRRLGDKRYAVREAAAKALAELGPDAVRALRSGIESADEEIRTRCAALLPAARAADWRRRADAYLADPEGKEKHNLPLLADWERLIGKSDAAARKLFADMVRTNGIFMEDTAADRKSGQKAVDNRSREALVKSWNTPPPGGLSAADLAAILFARAVVGGDPPIRPLDWFDTGYLLRDHGVAAAIQATDTGRAFRLVLARWAESRPLTDVVASSLLSELAMFHSLPEAVPALVRYVNNATGGTSRGEALTGLAKVKTNAAAEALAGMLDDPSNLWAKAGPGDIQSELRACALATLVKLKGKDPKDYWLTETVRWKRASPSRAADVAFVQLYGFASEKARTEGLAKWRAEAAGK
jgi:PBS lyase HEAT-like repeat